MDKNDIRKKVLVDIFAAPSSLFPIVLGSSLSLISWAGELSAYYFFGGFSGILIGFGLMATRLIFNIEGLTEKAFNEWKQQAEKEAENKLDELFIQLSETKSTKDEDLLREVRLLFNTYKENVISGKIANNLEISEKFLKLFNGCVQQLQESYDLWKSAKLFNGDLRKDTQKKRDVLLKDVNISVSLFAKTLCELLTIKNSRSSDLSELRSELDGSIEIIKKTEERLANLYSSE
jgi:hypothetical protein